MSRLLKTIFMVLAFVALIPIALPVAPFPKRGIAYNEGIAISNFGGGEVFWQYNWDSDTGLAQSFTEYVPMLWDDTPAHTDSWDGNVAKWLYTGDLPTAHLLGFNECDNVNQSNLTPQDAANSYRQWITPYATQGATLVGPSVTNGANGMPWMKEFWSLCSDCEITFAAFHWYDSTSNFAYLQKYVSEACALVAPAKVWITEFEALPNDTVAQANFMAQALPWLDDQPCVDRYAWFGSADPDRNLLVEAGPELSALGNQYVTGAFDNVNAATADLED